jgi:hypothetical protein
MRTLLLISICLSLGACYDPNAQSSYIVREVEAAGSGDISSLTTIEIGQWFARTNNRQLVHRVNMQCDHLRRFRSADWSMRTAEGRVCSAAQYLDMPIFRADPTQF